MKEVEDNVDHLPKFTSLIISDTIFIPSSINFII